MLRRSSLEANTFKVVRDVKGYIFNSSRIKTLVSSEGANAATEVLGNVFTPFGLKVLSLQLIIKTTGK